MICKFHQYITKQLVASSKEETVSWKFDMLREERETSRSQWVVGGEGEGSLTRVPRVYTY